MKKFSVGDRVTWRSSSGGSWTEKTGTVVFVLPAYRPSMEVISCLRRQLERDGKRGDFATQFDGRFGRATESYFVLVENGHRQAKLYWPLVSKLELARVIHG